MGTTISASTRAELVKAVAERYRAASPRARRSILDQFVAVTGYHRKHAIRLLNETAEMGKPARAPRPATYDEGVRQGLIVLWEASDRVCGKRLKALLPALVPALERHGHLRLDETRRAKIMSASAATIDRLLADARAAARGDKTPRRRALPGIRRSVPVRTSADWQDAQPGHFEADLVAHGGETGAGSFVHTLVLTDVATTWTECIPIVVRDSALIVEALEKLRTAMPIPLRGLDTDNGSEFLNEAVIAFCARHGIEQTRSRPYRKNDQAWVEQKNGAVVRRLVGYRRLEGIAAATGLGRLYGASRLFVNFFQPSFKLAEKRREGSRVSRVYHPPATPFARMLQLASVPEQTKARLQAVVEDLDPLRLLEEIRSAQHYIVGLAEGQVPHVIEGSAADLARFMGSLATAWRDGEVRPTHRSAPRPRRDWRTRADPFAAVEVQLRGWFERQPDITAKELLERLRREHTETYAPAQLRTLQRRVKVWRASAARALLLGSPIVTPLPAPSSGAIFGEACGNIPS